MFGAFPEPVTAEEGAEEAAPIRNRDPHDWRVEQYERLGFGYMQALELALAVDAVGFPLYHADVAALLERTGGDHDVTWRLLR